MFSGLSFELRRGEALVVTGPNGAGKSSLLRALVGLLPLAAGKVRWEAEDDRSVGEVCHYLGHSDALKSALTVRENLAFWAALLGRGGEPREA